MLVYDGHLKTLSYVNPFDNKCTTEGKISPLIGQDHIDCNNTTLIASCRTSSQVMLEFAYVSSTFEEADIAL
jgi:hypothetical protein